MPVASFGQRIVTVQINGADIGRDKIGHLQPEEQRIDGCFRFRFADFKMQDRLLLRPKAQFSNGLPSLHFLAFLHQATAIVAVGGEVGFIVLDDDQLAIAFQCGTAVDDPTSSTGDDDLAEVARLSGVTDLVSVARYPDPLAPAAAIAAISSGVA